MKTSLLLLTLILVSCATAEPAPINPPKNTIPGTFHPGPYTDPETGKHCSEPGGYCVDDQHCHSSWEMCHKK